MMGSRGDAPTQATALAVIYEIAELLRNADKTMPAAVKELRAAAAEAKTAREALDKTTAEHAARVAELDASRQQVIADAMAVAQHETEVTAKEAAAVRLATSLARQRAELAERKQELERLQGVLDGDKAEFAAAKMLHTTDLSVKTKAMIEETNRRQRESEAEIQEQRDDAALAIRQWRADAQADITVERQELETRSAALAAREEQFNRERARFSALLQE